MILALINVLSGCSPNRDNVAMFRGNLERTGFYDSTTNKLPSGQLNWKFKSEYECYSSPVISQGTVYINCAGGYLYAVNANSGKENWVFKREKWVGPSPMVSNGIVYVGGLDSYFYAVDIKTSMEKWRFKTGDMIMSSPAILNGIAYFGSYDGYLYALDLNTGQEKWRFKTQGVETPYASSAAPEYDILGAIVSSPAIANGVIYFGSYDGYLYALDLNTGQEKWRYKTGDGIGSSPSISDGVIFFGSGDGYFYALDNDGQLKWKFNTEIYPASYSPNVSSAAIDNGTAYFASEDNSDRGDNNYLFAVDTKTGGIKWKFKTMFARYTGPTVSNNVVYFADEDGSVFSVNAETGQVEWKFSVESAVTSDVAIVDDVIYFCTEDGYLYSLR